MPSAKYKYLPHTSDIKFVAYGSNFKEALENAALALINTMLDIKKISKAKAPTKRVKIREKASNKEDLVWYILQDIVSSIDADKLNAFKFEVVKLEGNKMEGNLVYKDMDSDNSMLEVKGITAHDLSVKESKNTCEITVLVDV